MKTTDLLHNLKPYLILSEDLKEQESVQQSASFRYRLTSSYSFITVELLDADEDLYLRIRFELMGTRSTLTDVYCKDISRLPALNTIIRSSGIEKTAWNESSKTSVFLNDTLTQYLNMADSIAARAMNCASGDNYRPGYYSTVCITEEEILLSQVNHMNAKSLDHKSNYSLRNFDMHIPLQHQVLPERYDHHIGAMWMMLDDRSSPNNKVCRDALLEQIGIEKAAFEK